jgi:zinc transport system ATP-binding protein
VNGAPAIAFTDVAFGFRSGVPVIREATFAVRSGALTCVIGPNGGGKTTLLLLILGLARPQSGTVRVLGQSPEEARTRVGYMPQRVGFDDTFPASVTDTVLMGRLDRHAFGHYDRSDRAAAAAALAEMGVADLAGRSFASLSGGQRQRVLIARALVSQPELLLLDEPTAYVDPAFADQFYAIVERLRTKMTVLIVSHDLGVVSEHVDQVVCVHQTVRVHPVSGLTGDVINEIYGSRLNLVRHDHDCNHGRGPHA